MRRFALRRKHKDVHNRGIAALRLAPSPIRHFVPRQKSLQLRASQLHWQLGD